MKIGIVGTLWIDIPPVKYGGTEAVISTLADKLVENGHDVTLFAPSTAKTKAKLISTQEKSLFEMGIGLNNPSAINYHVNHFVESYKRVEEFDILHVHLNKNHDYISLPLSLHSKTPVLNTLHFPAPTDTYRPEKYLVLHKFKYLPFTSISNAARMGNDWNFVSTVYNAIDIKQFTYSADNEDYFAWIGKIIPIKGLKEAIEIAKKANVKLKIMGNVETENSESVEYFNSLKPLIDNQQIIYMGEADIKMKTEVLGKAKAFINPLQWPEPFGLVMAESQAVGTPVIALNRGAANELIKHGETGFVVETEDEMIDAIKKVDTIDRLNCRKHIESIFTPEKMVEEYEKAYLKTIENWNLYLNKQLEYLNY